MLHRLLLRLSIAFLILSASATLCSGQTISAALVGTALDPNTAVVPGLKATVRCAEAAGFQRLEVSGIAPLSNDVRRLDLKLESGTTAASIEVVTGGPAPIEASGVPIMADESVHSPADGIEAVRRGAADMINIKLMKSGGVQIKDGVVTLSDAPGLRFDIDSAFLQTLHAV